MESRELQAGRPIYIGIFLVALSTLCYEIVLTRIFSLTMWYHFAFLAVSLAMLGMTAGALAIQLFPGLFATDRTAVRLSTSALFFALTTVTALLTHISVPVVWSPFFYTSAAGIFAIVLNCLMLALPFVFSGICVCLCLTRFKAQVSGIYAADLAGAAAACASVAGMLSTTDGPSTVILSAVLAAIASLSFACQAGHIRLMQFSSLTACCLAILTILNVNLLTSGKAPFLRIIYLKGAPADTPVFDRWNCFSAVRVYGDPAHPFAPTGWGLDQKMISGQVTGQLKLDIDGGAATVITNYRGNLQELSYLKADVSNIAHFLLRDARVFVCGVGGGRDILSALVFGGRDIVGVELNNRVLEALTKRFGDFAGHLERLPGVHLISDEARSYLSRSSQKFDLIQISMIDTFAATSAGAFSLVENSLYTLEAWKCFLNHLSESGAVSATRWYPQENPAEIYRLVSLAGNALRDAGATEPRRHIVVIRYANPQLDSGVGTLIAVKRPFSSEQIDTLKSKCRQLGFTLMLSPDSAVDPDLALLADAKYSPSTLQKYFKTNIIPPVDDCPYFFELAKLPSAWSPADLIQTAQFGTQGLSVLAVLAAVLSSLLGVCIFLPLSLSSPGIQLKKSPWLATYFLAIGLGFMFAELAQMQRLTIFLGHPAYSLIVVLFSMLAFMSAGSATVAYLDKHGFLKSATARMIIICLTIILTGIATSILTEEFLSSGTPARIAISILAVAPLGFAAGTAFPTGMALAFKNAPEITPWLWGLNGAASVLASVFCVLVSILAGNAFAYYSAAAFYLLAALAAFCAERR
jgi:spermidine synthase